jgi:uncharacterized membrane protein
MSEPAPESNEALIATEDSRVRRTELVISQTLRLGVVLSIGLIVLGTVFMFVHHPEYLRSKEALPPLITGQRLPHSLGQVAHWVSSWRGQGLISLGLLILILTPVLRVAISIVAFGFQRDRTFMIITSAVLGFLVASFLLGHQEG